MTSWMRALAGFARGFLQDLSAATVEEMALVIAKHVFLRMLKSVTLTGITKAIHENKNLSDTFQDWDTWLEVGEPWADKILANIDRITPQLILNYMRTAAEPHRAQAEMIMNTPNGPEWFVAQVDLIKENIKRYYSR